MEYFKETQSPSFTLDELKKYIIKSHNKFNMNRDGSIDVVVSNPTIEDMKYLIETDDDSWVPIGVNDYTEDYSWVYLLETYYGEIDLTLNWKNNKYIGFCGALMEKPSIVTKVHIEMNPLAGTDTWTFYFKSNSIYDPVSKENVNFVVIEGSGW